MLSEDQFNSLVHAPNGFESFIILCLTYIQKITQVSKFLLPNIFLHI